MTVLYVLLGVVLLWLFSRRGDFLVTYGRYLFGSEKREKALKVMRLAERIGGCSFDAKLSKAYVTLKLGEIDEAYKLLNLLSMQSRKPQEKMHVRMSQALVYWKQGNIDVAIEVLEDIIEKFPHTAGYGSLGMLYIIQGDIDKALQFNQAAYQYNTSDPTILDNLALSYYKVGDAENAEKYYAECVNKEPYFPEPYYYYGKVLAERGEKQRGVELMRQALTKRFSFTSTVTREQIQADIDAMENV